MNGVATRRDAQLQMPAWPNLECVCAASGATGGESWSPLWHLLGTPPGPNARKARNTRQVDCCTGKAACRRRKRVAVPQTLPTLLSCCVATRVIGHTPAESLRKSGRGGTFGSKSAMPPPIIACRLRDAVAHGLAARMECNPCTPRLHRIAASECGQPIKAVPNTEDLRLASDKNFPARCRSKIQAFVVIPHMQERVR